MSRWRKRAKKKAQMTQVEALATMLETGYIMALLLVIPAFHDPEMGLWFCAKCGSPGVKDPRNLIHEGDCLYPNGKDAYEGIKTKFPIGG